VAGGLNGGLDEDPIAVLYIRVFHEGHAAEAGHGDRDDSCIVFKLKEIRAIATSARRRFIGIERLDIADGALETGVAQMISGRIAQNILDLRWLDRLRRRRDESETDKSRDDPGGHVHQRYHARIVALFAQTLEPVNAVVSTFLILVVNVSVQIMGDSYVASAAFIGWPEL
jgi:hypothetical protein